MAILVFVSVLTLWWGRWGWKHEKERLFIPYWTGSTVEKQQKRAKVSSPSRTWFSHCHGDPLPYSCPSPISTFYLSIMPPYYDDIRGFVHSLGQRFQNLVCPRRCYVGYTQICASLITLIKSRLAVVFYVTKKPIGWRYLPQWGSTPAHSGPWVWAPVEILATAKGSLGSFVTWKMASRRLVTCAALVTLASVWQYHGWIKGGRFILALIPRDFSLCWQAK